MLFAAASKYYYYYTSIPGSQVCVECLVLPCHGHVRQHGAHAVHVRGFKPLPGDDQLEATAIFDKAIYSKLLVY